MQIRYEDVCLDPRATLAGIHEFLGTNPADTIQPFRQADHHVVGNGMRLDVTSDIHLDQRWRVILTEEDLRVFDSVAGAVNRRYGYR